MTYVVQFFSTLLAVMVIGKSYADYRRRNESWVMFVFWSITWLIIVYFAYFPQTIEILSSRFDDRSTGLGRVLGFGMTFLFFIIYRLYVKAERLERKLGDLMKQRALKGLSNRQRS